MIRGDAVCMDCHGTVVTGREKREVADGVSCQSCHGAAKDFLEPHQEGDKAQGQTRPGYVNALKLGMTELKDPATRAATCAGCHYITDPRLISSGHPSGADFDYASGMAEVRHWQSPPIATSTLAATYTSELAARGAVPKVRLARLASAPSAPAAGQASGAPGASQAGGVSSSGDTETPSERSFVSRRPRTPRARPASSRASTATGATAPLDLPPFPQIDDTTPVEDVLLLLRERLELLYRAVHPEEP